MGDVIVRVCFEGFADTYPGFRQGLPDVGELANVVFDGIEDFGKSAIIGAGKVGGEDFFEVREASAQLIFVNLAEAILFFIFNNQRGASFTEEFDDFEPVIKVGIVLAGVGNEEIEGTLGEEELVGFTVDFLPPEVPDVDAEGIATGMRKVETENINTFSRFLGNSTALKLEFVFGVNKLISKASFSRSAFTNNNKLSFVDIISAFF